MRRYKTPFNGKRFLLNTNTGEIHDLDCETDSCHIDEINIEHIHMTGSYKEALIYASMDDCPNPNGCFYCLPEKDNG